MVTVEADPVYVESRLAAGGIGCPVCREGALGGWGYARARRVEGLGDPIRPRRRGAGPVWSRRCCCR